eukprot:scaffold39069_cov154-Skeletonema_marinoi.AAC.12
MAQSPLEDEDTPLRISKALHPIILICHGHDTDIEDSFILRNTTTQAESGYERSYGMFGCQEVVLLDFCGGVLNQVESQDRMLKRLSKLHASRSTLIVTLFRVNKGYYKKLASVKGTHDFKNAQSEDGAEHCTEIPAATKYRMTSSFTTIR